jgi:putative colanic acid biosynthesis acetyltransferase WcaF
MFLWEICWCAFCAWTPKPFYPWRVFWLRIFGAKIQGKPFVHQRSRINMPWNITLYDHCSIGDRTNLYALGEIEVKEGAIIAQEAYLSAGTHDFCDPRLPLVTAKITIGESAFVGTRAFIMPGINIGDGALIGACSVVTKNMPAWTVCAGNPCKSLKPRIMKKT